MINNKKSFIEFTQKIGNLKCIRRKGWVLKGVAEPESIADHGFRVAFMVLTLTDFFPKLNRQKLLEMALIDDIGEVLTGDIKWEKGKKKIKSQKSKLNEERKAVKEIFKDIPQGKYYLNLWDEFNALQTPEAKFLKQIDKLEMALQAYEYEKDGYDSDWFNEFWENAEKYLKGGELEEIFESLKKLRSS